MGHELPCMTSMSGGLNLPFTTPLGRQSGRSTHYMSFMPWPITTSIASARLLNTTTSMVRPVSVWRTVIFSSVMAAIIPRGGPRVHRSLAGE